jgi:(1->4)-alpha-D-glucan 1-alpha-D-glucosylmutase
VVAFRRADDVLVAVTRWTVHLEQTGWGETSLTLPDGSWTDALTGTVVSGATLVSDLFAELPVALLERSND